ncbi:MAG: tRNA (guanosine(37)-N1)-methyltransferase TrmD [Deltaproteobacteria bacterium]|nr:tRNA (guanosine(37)-N1)-methyltransferase TrmD [Deltaproteobacteria bacterium]
MVQFDIITLFPAMFQSPLQESILKRAQQRGLVSIHIHDLRDYTEDKHRTADDTPYGGGAGMVMKVEPIVKALDAVAGTGAQVLRLLTSPQGRVFDQQTAWRYRSCERIVLVCGRYEGVDERVLSYVDEEVSVGDFILTGGELAAMVIVDAVSRLVPGVVGDEASVKEDTFENGLLKFPQYTRPQTFRSQSVPEVLVSGNHGKVRMWRKMQALLKTFQRRPDLIEKADLSDEDRKLLDTNKQI